MRICGFMAKGYDLVDRFKPAGYVFGDAIIKGYIRPLRFGTKRDTRQYWSGVIGA
jgi:hypothetical protein